MDDCKSAVSASNSMPVDTTPCRATGSTKGDNTFLNVASLLNVGGRPGNPAYPSDLQVSNTKFDGCVNNLIHNGKVGNIVSFYLSTI